MSARPTVLLIDLQAERLRELGRQLAAQGYEVVPVADAARAQRFAQGLGSAVIVVDPAALDPQELLAEGRTVVVLGQHPEDEEGLPDELSFLATAGLETTEVARRLLLVLLGRELGVGPDSPLSSLVGDLSQTPLIELLRGLSAAETSGHLDLRGGSLLVERGQVVAAVAGAARALKAFCRLGRLHEGPFRFMPGELPAQREIEEDLDALVLAAIEDSLGEFPDPRGQLEVEIGPSFFATPFSPLQQRILGAAQRGATLRQILDGLPDRDGEIVQEVLRLEEKGFLVRREPRVRVVTDSTSDLPPDVAGAHGIAVVPLTVAFGQEAYRDRVDLQPRRFYAMLREKKTHPASSPPASEDFSRRYGEWVVEKGHQVVSKRPVVAGVSHGNAPAWADRLEKTVRDAFQVAELIQAEVGPVVGTHAGPGVVSVSVFQPEGDEAGLIAPL